MEEKEKEGAEERDRDSDRDRERERVLKFAQLYAAAGAPPPQPSGGKKFLRAYADDTHWSSIHSQVRMPKGPYTQPYYTHKSPTDMVIYSQPQPSDTHAPSGGKKFLQSWPPKTAEDRGRGVEPAYYYPYGSRLVGATSVQVNSRVKVSIEKMRNGY